MLPVSLDKSINSVYRAEEQIGKADYVDPKINLVAGPLTYEFTKKLVLFENFPCSCLIISSRIALSIIIFECISKVASVDSFENRFPVINNYNYLYTCRTGINFWSQEYIKLHLLLWVLNLAWELLSHRLT